jgi:hypothetical protein
MLKIRVRSSQRKETLTLKTITIAIILIILFKYTLIKSSRNELSKLCLL